MHQLDGEPIWTGSVGDLRDPRRLHELGIVAVVELAADERTAELGRSFQRVRFPLVDNEGNDPAVVRCCVHAVASLFREGASTLVACSAGLNRTPVIVAAARAVARGLDLDESLREVSESVPTDVSPTLWREVREITANTGWDLPGPRDRGQSRES